MIYLSGGSWYITRCNITDDWCLAVDRGINCEDHTQVVSHHLTNAPHEESIKKAVEKLNSHITESINSFCEFMHSSRLLGWNFKDTVGLLFMKQLLACILDEAIMFEHEVWPG